MPTVTSEPQSISAYLADLKAGRTTVEQCTESHLARIEEQNDYLKTFLSVTSAYAKRAATAIDVMRTHHPGGVGPLAGAAISVKDLIDTNFEVTTYGSKRYQQHRPSDSAIIVKHIEHAHGVIIGKTNLHEFAYGVTNENDYYGNARNPVDPKRITGGSSGGSAASVKANMALASVGTDTGGSIRIPASLCGVVGYKPTHGLISVDGVLPLAPTLDHVGPLTKCVDDAARMVDVLTGQQTTFAKSTALAEPDTKIRVGIPRTLVEAFASGPVGSWFDEMIHLLEHDGAISYTTNVTMDASDVVQHQNNIISAEAYAVHADWIEQKVSDYGRSVYDRLMASKNTSGSAYIRSLTARVKWQARVDDWLNECDVFILPTTPITAQPFGTTTIDLGTTEHVLTSLMTRFTNPWNLAGCPAISLPVGTIDGLPIGLQLVGKYGRDAQLLRAARYLESYFESN